MKHSTIFAALSLIFVANVMAGETDAINLDSLLIKSHADPSKGSLIVAVTEPGKAAADTAWLLSDQVQANSHDTPFLLVLKPKTRIKTLKLLKLSATELPALIYLDSNGNELSRVIDAAPSTRIFQKKGISTNS